MNHKSYRIYGIDWDIDDEGDGIVPVLPSEIVIEANCADEPNAVEDYLSDYLSDTFGFCHKGFKYEEASEDNAEKLAQVREIVTNEEYCAECMVAEIGELVCKPL